MARILNIDAIALAQNTFRNAVRAEIAFRHAGQHPGAFMFEIAEALEDLYWAVIEEGTTVTIDECSAAFAAIGYSRELGAAVFCHIARTAGAAFVAVEKIQRAMVDVEVTPEWARLNRLYAEPVVPCCDWEVPASN